MSLSILLQQCPVCLVRRISMVCETGGKWLYNCYSLSAASRICSKQHVAFLYSSHLAFSLCVLLASRWCIHTVVLTQPELGRNSILFYQIRFSYNR